ncbi:integrase/recombinase XerC [Paraburkholderia sp. 32]
MVPLQETVMGNVRLPQHSFTNWLDVGPLAPHVDAFVQYLADRGYAKNSFATYVRSIDHFAQWIHRRRVDVCRIDESVLAEFLNEHLPSCRCDGVVQRHRPSLSAAPGHLLVVLRARGVITPPVVSKAPVSEELRQYDEYMDHVRGLAPKTRESALRIVGRFLTSRFGDYVIDIPMVRPEHVRRFFAQEAKLYSKPASAGAVVAALRGYFRYRASLGDLVHGLIGALSYPANWQLASLPKTLTTEEVERLIGSLGQAGRCPMRRTAIVRCALDLGLRSGEVARLGLDDIDWRAGTITLRHTKGRREDVLPLPSTTGAAIAAYLKDERPKDPQSRCLRTSRRPTRRARRPRSRAQDDSPGLRSRWAAIHRLTPASPHHGKPTAGKRLLPQGGGRRAAPSVPEHDTNLRQARQP